MPKKLTYEQVQQVFTDGGCELLESEYINADTPMRYRCNCGSESKVRLYDFRNGTRCKQCQHKAQGDRKRTPYSKVKEYFDSQGCELLSSGYKNNHDLLDYRCSCGAISKITFASFKQGHRCSHCSSGRVADARRRSIEEVRQIFKDEGCELLSDGYKNMTQKLDYICSCGNQSTISFGSFLNGSRCQQCGFEKLSGENNANWNPELTDEDRLKKRTIINQAAWRKKIFERDGYTCQCCGDAKGGNLNAHHLDDYNNHPDGRDDSDNGVTLCTTCHRKFHSIYGLKTKTTRKQFEEFLENKSWLE